MRGVLYRTPFSRLVAELKENARSAMKYTVQVDPARSPARRVASSPLVDRALRHGLQRAIDAVELRPSGAIDIEELPPEEDEEAIDQVTDSPSKNKSWWTTYASDEEGRERPRTSATKRKSQWWQSGVTSLKVPNLSWRCLTAALAAALLVSFCGFSTQGPSIKEVMVYRPCASEDGARETLESNCLMTCVRLVREDVIKVQPKTDPEWGETPCLSLCGQLINVDSTDATGAGAAAAAAAAAAESAPN
eukprot:scaffold1178_cov252-Pinguiococcus_pyrenoidosus.AAC.9